ncbi:MAG: hypothetical protein IJN29_04310, partial [Akkermansia sp.]|nr:hypothetical protein [Akkermansia sp.]
MKLHLPKPLCAAVLSALAMPAMGDITLTPGNIVTPVEGGDSYLDVGINPNPEDGYIHNINRIWEGDLVIGDTDSSTGDVDYVGSFDENWDWRLPDNSNFTNQLKVEGNVTVQGDGKVVLGGWLSNTSTKGLDATGSITVNGGSLTATNLRATDLVVTGGTVSTSTTGCNQGTHSTSIVGDALSYIKDSLTISGGELSFGYAGDDIVGVGSRGSRMTAFGDPDRNDFTIQQTGGTLRVYGDMILRDGATITQDGGSMVFRDTVWMDFTDTTTFNQNADSAKLVIGRLESSKTKNVHNVVFNQSGDGLIHLAYGSNFAITRDTNKDQWGEGTITLNQTGNGTINIGGGHDTDLTGDLPTNYALAEVDSEASTSSFECVNTTYTINQSGGGTINVNGSLSADEVNVGGESTLNLNENVTINSLTQSENGKITVAEDKTLTLGGMVIMGGEFVNNGTISGADAQTIISISSAGEFVNNGTVSRCTLKMDEDVQMSGDVIDSGITVEGGEISASISGSSSVEATSGTTTLSGENSYTGNTTIDNAELIVTKDGGLGTGVVVLKNGGILDLSNKSISNTIYVEGCTLRGGAAYKGDLITKSQLELDGDTTAKNVTLTENGSLTLDAANRLTILNGGSITLSDGCVLSVAGSLTLDGSNTLVLEGAYSVGTAVVTGEAGLTMGSVTLDYADSTVELERIGNSLVLVSKFKQGKADAMAQGNWGIATASRAFVNTVRGQRNNTGCIANGKGTAWFSLLGASNNLKGGDVSVEGAAVGADMKVGKCSVMGVAFGYTDGTVSPAGLRKVEQDGYYAAVYGEHGLRKLSA